MPLAETWSLEAEFKDDPPVRLGVDDIVIPADVDMTVIGTIHNGNFSLPTYASELFQDNYALFIEQYGWTAKTAKRLQRVSRGYPKAMEETLYKSWHGRRIDGDPGGGVALWEAPIYEAMYNSGIRVLMADFPIEHPIVKSKTYPRALDRFAVDMERGAPIDEQVMQELAKRDAYIVRAMCDAIPKLRSEDPRLDPDEPLKVAALYGRTHAAIIAGALSAAAAIQGVESFTARTMYEVMTPNPTYETAQAKIVEVDRMGDLMAPIYQNWLKTSPEE